MWDSRKTNSQLFEEVAQLRQRVAAMEKMEAALRESEERYRTLIENAPLAITLATVEGRWLFANEAATQLLGYSTAELEQQKVREIYKNPEDRKHLLRQIEQGKVVRDFETELKRKDGTIIHAHLAVTPMELDGQAVLLTMIEDFTAYKRAEAELRQSEARQREILETLPLGIHFYELQDDDRLVFIGANPAADTILKVNNAQFINQTIEEAFPPLADTEIPQRYREAAMTGQMWQIDQVSYEHNQISGAFEVHVFQTQPGRMATAFQDITERKRAEMALRKSEERFRLLSEIISDYAYSIVVEADGSTRYEWLTESFTDMTGFSQEEMEIQGRWQLIVHPDDLERVAQSVQARYAGEANISEFRIITKSGEVRWLRDYARPVWDDELGRIVRIYGAAHDITERKQMEEALREGEKRFRLLFERAPLGYQSLNAEGHLIEVNPAWLELLGFSRNEVIGRWFGDFLRPEETDLFKERFPRFKAAGETTTQFEMVRKDGSPITVAFNGKIGYDSAGNFQQTHCTLTNITQQRQAEEALRESEKRYRMTLDSMADAIHTVDRDLRVTMVNPATVQWLKVIGLPADAVGQNLFTMCPFLSEQVQGEYRRVFETGQMLITEETNPFGDRKVITETRKIPIFEREKVTQVLTVIRDITERKQVEQRDLELALEKERGETFRKLIGNIAHDLKTPLAIINTSLYLLEKHTDLVKQQQKIDNIKRQTHLLDSFIQDLLAIARFDADPELRLTLVDVNELVMRIEADHHSMIEEKQLTFTLELEETLPPIQADQTDLHRAFANLVENALNYTPEGNSVALRTSNQNNRVMIEVVDTGIGIDEDTLPLIFDRFYRAPEAQAIVDGGSGLGLAIVKRVVEMHNGTIEVKSAPGKGTAFRVLLPILNSSQNEPIASSH